MWQKIRPFIFIALVIGVIICVIAGVQWLGALLASAGLGGSIFTRADNNTGLGAEAQAGARRVQEASERVAGQVRELGAEIQDTTGLSDRTTELLSREHSDDEAVERILRGEHNS